MKLDLTFRPSAPPPPAPVIRRVKWWGEDAGMIADTYSVTKRLVNGQMVGQFQLVNVWSLYADGTPVGSWSANDTAAVITYDDWLHIGALQVPDRFDVQAKMKWLSAPALPNGWGSPINAVVGNDWQQVTGQIRQINAVFSGNTVEVLETRTMTLRWQSRWETVPMCRVKTGREVVHEVWGVNLRDEKFTPKGHVYLPLNCRTAHTWLMERWLV